MNPKEPKGKNKELGNRKPKESYRTIRVSKEPKEKAVPRDALAIPAVKNKKIHMNPII